MKNRGRLGVEERLTNSENDKRLKNQLEEQLTRKESKAVLMLQKWDEADEMKQMRWCVRKMKNADERFLLIIKEMKDWGAKSYEAVERTLFRDQTKVSEFDEFFRTFGVNSVWCFRWCFRWWKIKFFWWMIIWRTDISSSRWCIEISIIQEMLSFVKKLCGSI